MRIILEAAEALGPKSILFVPCAAPPHKTGANLLPFALRCALLRAALSDLADDAGEDPFSFAVSEAEGERDGPSYTVDTLRIFAARFPDLRPVFVMGTGDYSRLNTWKDWQELPEHADLAVLPRNAAGVDFFNSASLRFWPKARALAPPGPGVASAFVLPHGGRLLYVPQPRLEISSSLVRRRYCAGSSLDFLVPPGVLGLLRQKKELVDSLWKQEGS
jgi:nicotinate-nucleotide adenylyltransferase